MNIKSIHRRLLAILLLLSMLLGCIPFSVSATEIAEEEKPTVKAAGEDYTSTINALSKPAISYSTHLDASNISLVPENSNYPLVPLGDYVLLVKVGGKTYTFAPKNLTSTPSATVDSIAVTVDANGNYLHFTSDGDIIDSTITFLQSTYAPNYYERQFVRQDGWYVVPTGTNKVPGFYALNGTINETMVFFNVAGEDGMTLKKNIKYTDETNRVSHYVVYNNGKFEFYERNVNPGRTENSIFYLYQMHKITENLYAAIQNAKSYATGNADGKYDPELYEGFTTLLDECISLYTTYNHYLTKTEAEKGAVYGAALDTRAESLNAYIKLLDKAGSTPNYSGILSSNILTSRGWGNYIVDLSDHNPQSSDPIYTGLNGTYYIVTEKNGTYYMIDPTVSATTGTIGATSVTVSNGSVTKTNGSALSIDSAIDMIYETHPSSSNWNCYYLRTQNGDFYRQEYLNNAPAITRGIALKPSGIKFNKGTTDGIYLYRNAYYDSSGNKLGDYNSHLNYVSSKNAFAMELDTANSAYSTYRLYRLTWSTEDLYSAIAEMAAIADSSKNTTVPGVYTDFLNCLDESIAMLLQYNVAHTPEQAENASAIQAELKAQAIRLRSYKNLLGENSYSGILENLDTPYNSLVKDPISQIHSMDVRILVDSTYYIVHLDPNGNGTAGWAWAPDDGLYTEDENNRMYGAPVVISNDRVVNGQPTWAFLLKENIGNDGTIYKKEFAPWPVYESTFFVNAGTNIPNNSKPYALSYMVGKQVAFIPTVYDNGFTLYCNKDFDGVSGNERYYVQYVSTLNGFRPYEPNSITGETSRFHLYRLSSQVLDLYKAIEQVAVYTEGSNADGRYPEAEYNKFLSCLQESIDLYQYYNTSLHEDWNEADLKEQLDGQADTLLAHIGFLTLADTEVSYIDIPVEFLDFRADGFMLHYLAGGYGLNNVGDLTTKYGKEIANSLRAFDTVTPEGSPSSVSQNLTEPELINGNLVYTDKTILMVAYSLIAGLYQQAENIPGQNHMIKAMVDDLAEKAEAYTIQSPQWMALLGSPTDTFGKTSTETNGGELLLEDVSTACDIAYYITNYLWRPVSSDDTFDDGYTYNVTVPERSVFRLFLDEETGLYTLDAYNRVEYSGSHVFNAYPITDNDTHTNSPNFKPIDNLGFEKAGYMPNDEDTDLGQSLYHSHNYSTDGMNYHFTAHASGYFVYYEEQDLYFEFLGDDDVYFYINGKRALDLGGGHAAASGKLYLNDVAQKLSLVDGGVYSFDMFYAERKASASNLKFSTNILLAAPDTAISKGQYALTFSGQNYIDPSTGRGTPLADNATVTVGDTVAYSFDLSNTRDVPVFDLGFADASLGVSMTKNAISTYSGTLANGSTGTSLTNPDANHANGVVTQYSDLLFTYTTLDDSKTPQTSPVYELSASEMANKIKATYAVPSGSHYMTISRLPEGLYKVKVANATELKALLSAGIPTKCNLSIYGFLRKTTVDDLPYRNELIVTYSYPNSTDVNDGNSTVSGKAVRQIRVLEHSSMPQVRELEVVIDYGKAVTVPLEDLSDLIHFEDGSPVRIGSVVGFLTDGYNGQLLKKLPEGIFCTEEGQTAPGTQGTYSRSSTGFTFTPGQFLTQIETLYAVVQVEDFYFGTESTEEFHYILARMSFIPATIMYYETDFATGIFKLVQTTGEDWKLDHDDSDASDPEQDYERLTGTVSNTVIEREYIPSNAFFADFDGEGYERRYRDNPQYKGYDYDAYYVDSSTGLLRPVNWVINEANSQVATINPEAGTLSFTMKASKTSVFVQTGRTTVIEDSTLKLIPTENSFAQVRLQLKNFASDDSGNKPQVRIYYYDSDSTREDKIQYDYVVIPEDYLNSGEYFTVTIPLSKNYEEEAYIDRLRVQLWNVKNLSQSQLGVFTMDYIYVGPELGIDRDVNANYLFFGFDGTESDKLRYQSSIYGGLGYDYDSASCWTTTSNNTISTTSQPGNIVLTSSNTADYRIIHAGKIAEGTPLRYTPSGNDFCQIRVKISGATAKSGANPRVGLEFKKGYVAGLVDIPTEYLNDGQYHVYTFPCTAPAYLEITQLSFFRPTFYNFTKGTFTIDYIYFGPEAYLREINQAQDYLFFDFTDRDTDKLRYSNPVYGGQNVNFGLGSNWSVDTKVGDTVIQSYDTVNGTITFKDSGTQEWNYIHSAKNYYTAPLSYIPGKEDYLFLRMKVDKGSSGTCSSGNMTVALENFEEDLFFSYGSRDFSFADYGDGKYHIFMVPLDSEAYLTEDYLTAVRPVISGTQNCTFTVDYIYVGALYEANPAAQSLYFGFGDRGSGHWNADSLRYDSDSYGFINYDTGEWISVLPETDSILYKGNYGWSSISENGASVATNTQMGQLELTVPASANTATIQTYPTALSTVIYYNHHLQGLNYHPSEDGIVQLRFKTGNLGSATQASVTVKDQDDNLIASFALRPDLLAEDGYYILSESLPSSFCNADFISGIKISFEGLTGTDSSTSKTIFIDYIYIGPGKIADEPVYGYDSSYNNDTQLSNGSSFVVEGQGVKLPDRYDENGNLTYTYTGSYTEASFSFKGTGFDIISRTGEYQATIRLEVYSHTTNQVIKKLTVNNKGELELFQIPVVSVQGLEYGDYTVTLWVNQKVENTGFDFLNRGGQFHFDAVRIYDPMGKNGNTPEAPLSAYLTDLEAYPHIKEIRNILLSAETYESMVGAGTGALFVDAAYTPEETIPVTDADGNPTNTYETITPEGIEINNHYTLKAETYNKVGPKNEVYLAPGQGVAFKLQISTTLVPHSVDVGVKTIEKNTSGNLVAGIVSKGTTGTQLLNIASRREVTISSATAQYYALPVDATTFFTEGDYRYCYIVLYNNGTVGSITDVISLTDVKVAYDTMPVVGLPQDAPPDPEIHERRERSVSEKRSPDAYFDFMVDGQTTEAAALVMKAVLETPLLAEGTKIMHSLDLASDISINYAVKKTDLESYDSFYLECLVEGREGALRIDPVEKGDYYYFTLEGITAVQMTNTVTATLHMTKDGRNYYSEADIYSVAQYTYSQLSKEGASEKLKKLCAELLRYGAMAQIYKGYGTDVLADHAMTEEQKALLADLNTVTFGSNNQVLPELADPKVTWAGKSLILDSKVTLRYIVDLKDPTVNAKDLSVRVRYTDYAGTEKEVTLTGAQPYGNAEGRYSFDLDTLLAAELRRALYATVYVGESQVSDTLLYSVDTYGNNKTGTLRDLCKALFAYSDSAKRYFNG